MTNPSFSQQSEAPCYTHTLETYPIYKATPDNTPDLNGGQARKRAVDFARMAIANGRPIPEVVRDYLLANDGELRELGGMTLQSYYPSGTVIETGPVPSAGRFPAIARELTNLPFGESGRRKSNGQAIVRRDYEGSLGGGTPRNPLRIPGLIRTT